MKTEFNKECITFSQVNMIFNARLFWRRLSTWIRVYLISMYAGIGDPVEVFGRLYIENQNFGDLLQIVFSRRIASQFSGLLNQYTIGIREVITSHLRGDSEAVSQAVDRLYGNVEDRVAFLSSVNPYFDEEEWREILTDYLRYTIEEANAIASSDFERDIELFELLTEISDRIGYVFAEGLFEYITSGCRCGTDIVSPEQCLTYEQVDAIYDLRMFWFDVVTWSRSHMLALITDIGNEEEVLEHFNWVSDNLGDMMQTIFGEEAATISERLSDTFINLMDGLIQAQMAGNIDEVDRHTKLLYQDADEFAELMASINPYWEESVWRAMLYDIVRNMISEVTTLLSGDYALNLDIFSTLLNQAETTSDYFAQGLYQYVAAGGRFPNSR